MAEGGTETIRIDEAVTGCSEIKVLEKRIRELERALGEKTLENEIRREPVKIAYEKNVTRVFAKEVAG
jgi:transposase